MPSARQYQEALARLRTGLSARTGTIWAGLGGYDEANVAPFVRRVVPLVAAAQRRAGVLTVGYLATPLGRFVDVPPDSYVGAAVRNGTAPEDVYRRPFVNVWTALAAGTMWADAVASGLARLTATAEMDVALAARAAGDRAMRTAGVTHYERVPDGGACELCVAASQRTYRVGDLMPLHNRCGCTVEPVMGGAGRSSSAASGEVAVHEHGELGPVLGRPGDSFDDLS